MKEKWSLGRWILQHWPSGNYRGRMEVWRDLGKKAIGKFFEFGPVLSGRKKPPTLADYEAAQEKKKDIAARKAQSKKKKKGP